MSRLLVLGSVNTDLVIRTATLPRPGETVLGGHFFQAAGGKGANQAVAAARLSQDPVTFIAAVGDDDYGKAALDGLRTEHLETEFVTVVSGCTTGVALIMVDENGQNCISVASGANARLSPEAIGRISPAVFARHAVFLACLETPFDTVCGAIVRARNAGLLTILNPAPAAETLELPLDHVDVLTPNAVEAGALTGRSISSPDDAAQAAADLCDQGCGAVVVTLGDRGAVVFEHGTSSHLPAVPVDAVDATAAGDAFNGALAVRLGEGAALVEAARFATRAAASSVTKLGAQPSLPKRSEVSE